MFKRFFNLVSRKHSYEDLILLNIVIKFLSSNQICLKIIIQKTGFILLGLLWWPIIGLSAEIDVQGVVKWGSEVNETSGLASDGSHIWTINDSGNPNRLYRFSLDGNALGSVLISNATNVDWESLGHDENFLYVADTGNNLNMRKEFTIYRVALGSLERASVEAELITISYKDYVSGNLRSHNFDAEAIAIRGDEIWLFTKNRGDGNTNLYRFPKVPGIYEIEKSQTLPVDSLVTAADIDPLSGQLVLLSTRRRSLGRETTLWHAPTTKDGVVWAESQSWQILPQDQWEGVLWGSDSEILRLTHENNEQGFSGLAEVDLGEIGLSR